MSLIAATTLITSALITCPPPPAKSPYGGALPTLEGPNKDVEPIELPNLRYPESAIHQGLSGECTVFLDVLETGHPVNVRAECTNAVFEKASTRALGATCFPILEVDGKPRRYSGVAYPLEYKIVD